MFYERITRNWKSSLPSGFAFCLSSLCFNFSRKKSRSWKRTLYRSRTRLSRFTTRSRRCWATRRAWQPPFGTFSRRRWSCSRRGRRVWRRWTSWPWSRIPPRPRRKIFCYFFPLFTLFWQSWSLPLFGRILRRVVSIIFWVRPSVIKRYVISPRKKIIWPLEQASPFVSRVYVQSLGCTFYLLGTS